MKWNRYVRRDLLAAMLAGGLFVCPTGCGNFENAGTVSGTVLYKGQPLSEGSVSFVGNNGQVATGTIDRAGRYVVSRVPVGSARVTVQVMNTEGPPPISFSGVAMPAQGTATGAKIPLRYSLAATSGLSHSVTKGKQQLNIDLTE